MLCTHCHSAGNSIDDLHYTYAEVHDNTKIVEGIEWKERTGANARIYTATKQPGAIEYDSQNFNCFASICMRKCNDWLHHGGNSKLFDTVVAMAVVR